MTDESPKKFNTKTVIREFITFALIAGFIVLPFRMYVAEPYLVDGRSMDPTFHTGDYLIVDKISKSARYPERHSVMVLEYPNNPSKSFIKRVIGLPGETIIVKNNEVTIINSENPDGFVLEQPYIVHQGSGFYERTLSGDEYFVMGDNRAESYDSRYWGPVNKTHILGRPVIQLFPFNKISLMPGSYKN